jgi:hypothetical protein
MAARTRHINHDEPTKRRIQASQLLNRLVLFANNKVRMTPAQVLAAKVVIGKCIPDLRSIEHIGKDGGPIKTETTLTAEDAYLRMVRGL